MSQIDTWKWNAQRSKAATLLAEGRLTQTEIAERVGINRRQLTRWRKYPAFSARVHEKTEEVENAILRCAIANKFRRIWRLQHRWEELHRIIEERAADPTMRDVPGGNSGLLVRKTISIGSGENARLVDLYRVDTALLQQCLKIEKQAARECGQWEETAKRGAT